MSKREIRLTKLSDDYFEGNHPNAIDAGYTKTLPCDWAICTPEIGERFYFGTTFSTSIVTKIISDNEHECIFKTLYSTYKLEK